MKLVVGRIISALVSAGGWLLVGVRSVLDLIGYSTIPDDAKVAATRLDQFFLWLLGVPWWVVFGFALTSTMWLTWVSWPRPYALPSSAALAPLGDGNPQGNQPTFSKNNSAIEEITSALPPSSRRPADMKKVFVIDELYPELHDLSEEYVDRLGNKSSPWRDYFLNGRTTEYIELMQQELRIVGEKYETIRKTFQRHKIFEDIYRMDNEIALRLNAVGSAVGAVKLRSDKLSNSFDEKSIELVEGDVKAMHSAIGSLRTYLSRDCMGDLITMRRDEMSRPN